MQRGLVVVGIAFACTHLGSDLLLVYMIGPAGEGGEKWKMILKRGRRGRHVDGWID